MENEPTTRLTIDFIPASQVSPVISVSASDTVEAARTLMELYDFSQLPVMRGKGQRPVGVVSWESIGQALLRNREATLADCMRAPVEPVKLGSNLLDAIPKINRDGFVLVTDRKGDVTGIVTSADLGDTLANVARPYLAIAECERVIRKILHICADRDVSPPDTRQSKSANMRYNFSDPDDLTLGEAVAAITSEPIWSVIGTGYDLSAMRTYLGDVVSVRNKVMHFRPLIEDAGDVIERAVAVLTEICERLPSVATRGSSSQQAEDTDAR